MENVINAFAIINEKIDSFLQRKYVDGTDVSIEDYYKVPDEYLCNIQNKLLSLTSKDARIYYSRIISRIIDDEYTSLLGWINGSREDYERYEVLDTAVYMFIARIIALFRDCDIELVHYLEKQDNKQEINYKELNRLSTKLNSAFCDQSFPIHRVTSAKATLVQQWTIIRNLMECATDWRLTNGENRLMYNKTDVAKFLSFLCGGSEDRIRKHLENDLPAKDVNEIIPYLENIGLHEISNRIKKDSK